MIRSVDDEALQDICRDIALNNYGFLYVNDHKDELQTEYESADTGLMAASSLSRSDIEEVLQAAANEGISSVKRLRSGVYYYDPFTAREGSRVSKELKRIFTGDLVVNKQTIESRFDIAPTDVEFFATELEGEDFIHSIAAGERDYYVSGPRLKDETSGETSVAARLSEGARHGTISHSDLEDVIDVAATSDVIRFLERENFIVDLSDEYLVRDAIDNFCSDLARGMLEPIAEEFGDVGYALSKQELDRIILNQISDMTDVLHIATELESDLLEGTSDAVSAALSLEERKASRGTEIIVAQSNEFDEKGFAEFTEEHANLIFDRVVESDTSITRESDYREIGHPMIGELDFGETEELQSFIQAEIKDRFDQLVAEEWAGDSS
jgi:hypothetical protein